MVLSASSVVAFAFMGSSFAIVSKQAMWVVIGLPLMWVASRLPVRAWRAFAYLGADRVAGAAVSSSSFAGTEVNGNQNWLDFGGPFRIQPSELAKLALVLWGADLLARKQQLLAPVEAPAGPVRAGRRRSSSGSSCSAATSAPRSSWSRS